MTSAQGEDGGDKVQSLEKEGGGGEEEELPGYTGGREGGSGLVGE